MYSNKSFEYSTAGILGVFVNIISIFGQLFGSMSGELFNFSTTSIVAIVLMTLFAILLPFFPETPIFLVKQNKIPVRSEYVNSFKTLEKFSSCGKSMNNSIFQQGC